MGLSWCHSVCLGKVQAALPALTSALTRNESFPGSELAGWSAVCDALAKWSPGGTYVESKCSSTFLGWKDKGTVVCISEGLPKCLPTQRLSLSVWRRE